MLKLGNRVRWTWELNICLFTLLPEASVGLRPSALEDVDHQAREEYHVRTLVGDASAGQSDSLQFLNGRCLHRHFMRKPLQ